MSTVWPLHAFKARMQRRRLYQKCRGVRRDWSNGGGTPLLRAPRGDIAPVARGIERRVTAASPSMSKEKRWPLCCRVRLPWGGPPRCVRPKDESGAQHAHRAGDRPRRITGSPGRAREPPPEIASKSQRAVSAISTMTWAGRHQGEGGGVDEGAERDRPRWRLPIVPGEACREIELVLRVGIGRSRRQRLGEAASAAHALPRSRKRIFLRRRRQRRFCGRGPLAFRPQDVRARARCVCDCYSRPASSWLRATERARRVFLVGRGGLAKSPGEGCP